MLPCRMDFILLMTHQQILRIGEESGLTVGAKVNRKNVKYTLEECGLQGDRKLAVNWNISC